MRREFGQVMADLVQRDKRVHLISLDVGYGIFDRLKEENPGHYWNLGVTEQAAIGVAAGMALEGLRPYVYTITPFVLERPFEQIKLDIVEQGANVKLVGFWNYPKDGPTHRTRDVKGLCQILGIPLYEPGDAAETREMLERAWKTVGPAFFSLTGNPSK